MNLYVNSSPTRDKSVPIGITVDNDGITLLFLKNADIFVQFFDGMKNYGCNKKFMLLIKNLYLNCYNSGFYSESATIKKDSGNIKLIICNNITAEINIEKNYLSYKYVGDSKDKSFIIKFLLML